MSKTRNQTPQDGRKPVLLIAIGRQRERVELAEHADIGEVGFAGGGRLVGRGLHGRQLQAEVTQLHTT